MAKSNPLLIDALRQTQDEASDTVELDQTSVGRLSRMDALQSQAMSQALQARNQQTLRDIATALARMESGDYGYCLECGEQIAIARLQLNPSLGLCITCASLHEQ